MDITIEVSEIINKLKSKGANKVSVSMEGEKEFTILVSAMDPKVYYLIRSFVFFNFKDKIDMYCEITNPLKYHEYINDKETVEIK